jgi:hypothetical protein
MKWKKPVISHVRSIFFRKQYFPTKAACKHWAQSNGVYKKLSWKETDNIWILISRKDIEFKDDDFTKFKIDTGVYLKVNVLK